MAQKFGLQLISSDFQMIQVKDREHFSCCRVGLFQKRFDHGFKFYCDELPGFGLKCIFKLGKNFPPKATNYGLISSRSCRSVAIPGPGKH